MGARTVDAVQLQVARFDPADLHLEARSINARTSVFFRGGRGKEVAVRQEEKTEEEAEKGCSGPFECG